MGESEKLVFEISWETVNKVGGVHTVVKTKAFQSVLELGESYYMVGPFNPKDALTEVQPCEIKCHEVNEAIHALKSQGIKVHTGNWMVPGNPKVILFDIMSGYPHIEGWRHELGERNSIQIPVFDKELSEALSFGGIVGWFLAEVRKNSRYSTVIIAHFHEWLSSIGLIFLKTREVDIGLVFTTHATLLGRHLSAGGCDVYFKLKTFDCDLESGKRGFYPQYCIERAACHCSNVFTSVSHITAEEAEVFLGRYPDVITPNGLYLQQYVALHEFQNLHIVCKRSINEFVMGHFFGSYYFDLDKTVYLFSAGRYEFSNKGVDILLESVYRLNQLLKAKNADVTVVLFLVFNAKTNNYNIESLKNQASVRQLRQTIQKIQNSIGERIFDNVVIGKIPNTKDLMEDREVMELRKFIHNNRCGGSLPPIVTHNMLDDVNDPVLCTLRRLQMFNSPDDKVKIIFHPTFLTSTNPLFPIEYENFVRGCHLGVFPSYYEPWGYTPAECTMLGIPSLTSNLSGFGQYMEEHVQNPSDYGIYIVNRRTHSLEESINQMTRYLFGFVRQTRRERIMQRNRCERLCEILDWKKLNNFYTRARMIAVERTHPDKLSVFKESHMLNFTIPKIQRTMSMSPRSSEPSSDDEYPHLWGTNEKNN